MSSEVGSYLYIFSCRRNYFGITFYDVKKMVMRETK